MRVRVRVRPGAGRTAVGGAYGEALVVRVAARAVDGAATEAALAALSSALGLARRDVSLVTGATSRTKIVELAVSGAEAERVAARLAALLRG